MTGAADLVAPRGTGVRPGLVLTVACAAAFLGFLDTTVVNVAFPDLRADFSRSPLSTISWVITGYAVAFAALLTPAGRFGDLLGRKVVFMFGVAAFTVASIACAAAPTLAVLIVARTLQGAAAAAMIPVALGLILATTPPERRAAAVGVFAASTAVAAGVGPTLGGILIDAAGWRSVFVINVPVGVAALVAGARILPEIRADDRTLPDVLGTAILAAGFACLVISVSKAADWGWTAWSTLSMAAAGAVLLAVALRRAGRHPAPALETRLWSRHSFAVANLTSVFFGVVLYGWLLLGVLFLTVIWRYSVLDAGLAVSPGAVTSVVAAVAAGRLADRRGQRGLVVGGALMLVGLTVWLRLALSAQPDFVGVWLPAGLVSGIALGAMAVGLTSAAAAAVDDADFAQGGGLNQTARQIGGAIGVALLAAVLEGGGLGLGAFLDVYVVLGVAAVATGVAGLGLPAGTPVSPRERSLEARA